MPDNEKAMADAVSVMTRLETRIAGMTEALQLINQSLQRIAVAAEVMSRAGQGGPRGR